MRRRVPGPESADTDQQAHVVGSPTPSFSGVGRTSAELRLKQAAGNAAVTSWLAPPTVRATDAVALRRAIVQRVVSSWGGDFDTPTYRTEKDGAGNPVGVKIKLEFTPNDKADSTRIGMTQAVNSKDVGVPVAADAETGGRSVAAGASKGLHIDQLAGFVNPIFYTKAGAAGDTLASTARAADGRDGFRFLDNTGALKERSARIEDTPVLDPHGANASQIFESTAIAMRGVQAGVYYGSVRWGWRTNAAGKFHRLPLTLVSDDAPSASFNAARRLWNTTKTAAGVAHVRLSGVLTRFAVADDVEMVADPADPAATLVGKLAKADRLQIVDGVRKSGKDWLKGTATSGTQIGLVGWTFKGDVTDVKPAGP
jgi:hypothetical protein